MMKEEKTVKEYPALELALDDELVSYVELVTPLVPQISATYDQVSRSELAEALEDQFERDEMSAKFEMLYQIFKGANTVDDLAKNVEKTHTEVSNRYNRNMMEVYNKTKGFEKTARSLNLLYENAHGKANVYILPVNAAYFADGSSPKHFDVLEDYLRKQWYKFQMEDSPFYVTYVGDIGSKSAMDKMAHIAQETRALAVVDVKEMGDAERVQQYADKMKITGISSHLAHLVVAGTYVHPIGAREYTFIEKDGRIIRHEKPMAVPAASGIIGKILAVKPGISVAGLESAALTGINGVSVDYNYERIDAKEFSKRGVIMILPSGHVQGASTANKSSNRDLNKFDKVDIANALLKDLVQFCNNKAYSKWGKAEQVEFTREIKRYLNIRVKNQLIEKFSIGEILYDTDEDVVCIDIKIQFKEIADEFEISLSGESGGHLELHK